MRSLARMAAARIGSPCEGDALEWSAGAKGRRSSEQLVADAIALRASTAAARVASACAALDAAGGSVPASPLRVHRRTGSGIAVTRRRARAPSAFARARSPALATASGFADERGGTGLRAIGSRAGEHVGKSHLRLRAPRVRA